MIFSNLKKIYNKHKGLFLNIYLIVLFSVSLFLFIRYPSDTYLYIILWTVSIFALFILLSMIFEWSSIVKKKKKNVTLKDFVDHWENVKNQLDENIDLTQIPFTFLMGESGSGKTTALVKSSFFNIEEGAIKNKDNSVQQTSKFNFFLSTDPEIIFFDTAGHYSCESIEKFKEQWESQYKGEWEKILELISKYRPNCPINSIILTIPITSLLGLKSPVEPMLVDDCNSRIIKALILRLRLNEIYSSLKVQVPIYIMVSKLDLVPGFNQFRKIVKIRNPIESEWLFGFDNKKNILVPEDFDIFINETYQWIMNRLYEDPKHQKFDTIYTFQFLYRLKELKKALFDDYLKIIFAKEISITDRKIVVDKKTITVERDRINEIIIDDKKKNNKPFDLFYKGCFFSTSEQPGSLTDKKIKEDYKDNTGQGDDTGERSRSYQEFSDAASFERQYFFRGFFEKIIDESNLVKRTINAILKNFLIKFLCLLLILFFLIFWGYFHFNIYLPLNDAIGNIITDYTTYNNKQSVFRSTNDSCVNIDANNVNIRETIDQLNKMFEKRNSLDKNISNLFVPAKIIHDLMFDESLIDNLKNIEKNISVQRLFFPILFLSAEIMNKNTLVSKDEEKEKFLEMLTVYLSIFCELKPKDFFNVHEVLYDDYRQVLEGVKKPEISVILTKYPPDNKWNIPCYEDLALSVRVGIEQLYSFWLLNEMKLSSINLTVKEFIKEYNNILNSYSQNNVKNIKYKCGHFTKLAEKLIDIINRLQAQKELLKTPSEYKKECLDDYKVLSSIVDPIDNSNNWFIQGLKKDINEQKEICKQVYSSLTTDWDEIKSYPFIIDSQFQNIKSHLEKTSDILDNSSIKSKLKKGKQVLTDLDIDSSKSPKIEDIATVKTSLELIIEFHKIIEKDLSKFVSSNIKMNKKEMDFIVAQINQLNRRYQEEIKNKKEVIKSKLSTINSSNNVWDWDKNNLTKSIDFHLNNELCTINYIITQELNKHFFSDSERKISSHEILSFIKHLNDVKDSLKNENQYHCNQTIIKYSHNQVKKAYETFIIYWDSVIDEICNELNSYSETTTWNEMKALVLENETFLLNPNNGQLANLRRNVSPEDLKKLKEITIDYTWESSIVEKYIRIKNTCSVFAINSTYSEDIVNIQHEYIENIRMYSQSDFNEDRLKQLGELNLLLQSSEYSNEVLSNKLKAIGEHAFDLYHQDNIHVDRIPTEKIKIKFVEFLKEKQNDFCYEKDRSHMCFPFGQYTSKCDQKAIDKKLLNFFKEMDDFLIQKCHIKNIELLKNNLDKQQINFLEQCRKWRDFLYEKSYKPKMHEIEIELQDKHPPNNHDSYYFGEMLTSIEISINAMKQRILINDGDYKKTFNWSISSSKTNNKEKLDDEYVAVIIGKYDEDDIAVFKIGGGSLSLPGYLMKEKKNVKEWFLDGTLNFIKKDSDSKHILVPLSFKWNEEIPEIIVWPK